MSLNFICSLLLIIGFWIPRDNSDQEDVEWRAFKTLLNMWFCLKWTVLKSNTSVDFTDLTITLQD
eukprot:1387938-Ditylum_brightwellii.AAC.1